LSRKTKVDSCSSKDAQDFALRRETASRQTSIVERSSLTTLSEDLKSDVARDTDLKFSEGSETENSVSKEFENTSESSFENCNICPNSSGFLQRKEGDFSSSIIEPSIGSHSSGKVTSREKINLEPCTGNAEILLKEGVQVSSSNLRIQNMLRRKETSLDKNPKPMKRRRSVQVYSGASYAYRTQSLIGIDEQLQDGFYDAGREHPFCTLEALESQHESLESREVILVDRYLGTLHMNSLWNVL
jgi:hypothetical protein